MPLRFYNGASIAKPAISWWVSGRAICLVMTTYGVLSLAGGLLSTTAPFLSVCVSHHLAVFPHIYTSCRR